MARRGIVMGDPQPRDARKLPPRRAAGSTVRLA
jgi:hypothetical protein